MWFEADSYTFPPVVDFYPGGPDHHPGRWSGTSAIQDGFGAFERGDFSERHPFISSGTSDEWSEIATSKVSVRTMNEDEGPIVVTGTRYSRLTPIVGGTVVQERTIGRCIQKILADLSVSQIVPARE